ncbi:hypothetical protein EUGRSUZ_J02374 [Eucalyptus grandis]|uniref:Uncharacterized protein n=2 Tax=Eucalyptus grandis TaxID=71139 RepID=A0ACC3J8P1_EUCGR|nr:hypothetical protein EUGRSUZ_J02374 [Eucalyptus grandis]
MAEHEVQYFELKRHREIVVDSYLPFVIEEAKSIKQRKKTLELYSSTSKAPTAFNGTRQKYRRQLQSNGQVQIITATEKFMCKILKNIRGKTHWNSLAPPCSLSGAWSPVNLNQPSTLETLAMDPKLKKMLIDDLDRFVGRKEYYRRVGKAWKRGYLFLVAAMANYLKFDIYDQELSGLRSNVKLRRLLVTTANQSILVVEDIDCTMTFQDRRLEAQATSTNTMSAPYRQQDVQLMLSGFLNFIDGLWSSCGDEQIIVFPTNHKERLDPAVLHPGHMNVEVPILYCIPCGFRLLSANYLKINRHELFNHIESLLETARVTPAEVTEQLLKSDEPEVALRDMVIFLVNHKRKENDEVVKKKVCQCQLVEENGASVEESRKCKLIEE